MPFRLFALPAHRLASAEQLPLDELLEPSLPAVPDAVESALQGAEFRGRRAEERLRDLLNGRSETALLPSVLPEHGPLAVFAQPPMDLPALLRLADELETLAQQGQGERALVWNCKNCGTRYAVPTALVRPVAIRCEKCGDPVELTTHNAPGEDHLVDPQRSALNQARKELASFFREAMARGWPVLVTAKG